MVGISLPLNAVLGLALAAGVMCVSLLLTVWSLFRIGPHRSATRPRVA